MSALISGFEFLAVVSGVSDLLVLTLERGPTGLGALVRLRVRSCRDGEWGLAEPYFEQNRSNYTLNPKHPNTLNLFFIRSL